LAVALLFALVLWAGCGDDDDNTGTGPDNQAPVISAITAEPDTFPAEDFTTVTVTASDPDGDNLTYAWEANASWLLPLPGGTNQLELTNCCPITEVRTAFVTSVVSDGRGGQAKDSVQIWVKP
jgi:hypothetical protein